MAIIDLRTEKNEYNRRLYLVGGVSSMWKSDCKKYGVQVGDTVIGIAHRLTRVMRVARMDPATGNAVLVVDDTHPEERRIRKHVHNGTLVDNFYADYLIVAAPDVLWYHVEDTGDYQGTVYGIGVYEGRPFVYENGYGSCSGCGAWAEGGAPENQKEVLASATFFSTEEELDAVLARLKKHYENPSDAVRAAGIEALKGESAIAATEHASE